MRFILNPTAFIFAIMLLAAVQQGHAQSPPFRVDFRYYSNVDIFGDTSVHGTHEVLLMYLEKDFDEWAIADIKRTDYDGKGFFTVEQEPFGIWIADMMPEPWDSRKAVRDSNGRYPTVFMEIPAPGINVPTISLPMTPFNVLAEANDWRNLAQPELENYSFGLDHFIRRLVIDVGMDWSKRFLEMYDETIRTYHDPLSRIGIQVYLLGEIQKKVFSHE